MTAATPQHRSTGIRWSHALLSAATTCTAVLALGAVLIHPTHTSTLLSARLDTVPLTNHYNPKAHLDLTQIVLGKPLTASKQGSTISSTNNERQDHGDHLPHRISSSRIDLGSNPHLHDLHQVKDRGQQ